MVPWVTKQPATVPTLEILNDLPDDGAAEVDLLDLGDEHALDGLLDLVGHLVDDVVAADVDLLLVGQRDARGRRGRRGSR